MPDARTADDLWTSHEELELYMLLELEERQKVIEERDRLEGNYYEYLQACWPLIEATKFIPNWHLELIGEHLEAVALGQIKRLQILVPPRSSKSSAVAITWPTHVWTKDSGARFVFCSYSQMLSEDHALKRKTILTSDWYQRRWGHLVKLRKQTVRDLMNFDSGRMIATSVEGTATGLGGRYLILDDLIKADDAYNDLARSKARRFLDTTLTTRADDWKSAAIILIMQRLHEDDPAGHFQRRDGEGVWTIVRIPMEAEIEERFVYPLSGRVHTRSPGESMCEERFPRAMFPAIKAALGSWGFASQMQQRPSPLGGGIFKRHSWNYWQPKPEKPADPLLPKIDVTMPDGTIMQKQAVPLDTSKLTKIISSWDCAFKDKITSDFVAGLAVGELGADIFVLGSEHDRLSFSKTKDAIRRMKQKFPQTGEIWIEDKANGTAVIEDLTHEIPGIIAKDPRGGKMARAHVAQPFVEAGNVYLLHPLLAPWVQPFIEELGGFPNSANDDWVDAFTQAVVNLRQGSPGILEFFRREAERIVKMKADEAAKLAVQNAARGYVRANGVVNGRP
jgi:predicted phage terminase large subunit-like protein